MPAIERKTGFSLPLIQQTIVELKKLKPKPGADFNNEHIPNVTPDVFVELGEDGKYLRGGQIYLEPGGFHLKLEGNNRIILEEGPRVNFVQPSVDVAMKSLLKPLKRVQIIGVILTGMGKDGAEGIRHIKSLGGTTIAQDQESSAIYGMPKAAVETGAVDCICPPHKIGKMLVELLS